MKKNETELKEIGRVEFETNEKKYCYEFELLTVEQAELAREIGEWKYHQLQNPVDNFNKIIDSRGAEYLIILMSYLLREMKENQILPFDKIKAETEAEAFVKNLPAKEIEKLRECVNDFFTNSGRSPIGLAILQNERKRNTIEMFLPILQQLNMSKG